MFGHANDLFQKRWELRGYLDKLISDATDELSKEALAKAGHNANDSLGTVQFNILTQSGTGHDPIYMISLWLSGRSISDYMNDLARKLYPLGTKWSLQTLASRKTDGAMKVTGGREEAMKWIGQIMKYLETSPKALEYRRQTREVRELGQMGTSSHRGRTRIIAGYLLRRCSSEGFGRGLVRTIRPSYRIGSAMARPLVFLGNTTCISCRCP